MILCQQNEGKLCNSHINESFSKIKKTRETPTVGEQFRAPDLSDIARINDILEGKEFCVLTDYKTMKKNEIERKIHQHGGQVVQNPGIKR